jgi:hypothetical protein
LVELRHGRRWLKGGKDKLEEEKKRDDADEGNNNGTFRRSLAALEADGTEERPGNQRWDQRTMAVSDKRLKKRP